MSEWMRAARRSFYPGEQQPCAVCGEYGVVAHAHHIFPLALQFRAKCGWDLDDDFGLAPDHDFAWLCPTHHALVHMEISKFVNGEISYKYFLPRDESEKVFKLVIDFAKKLEECDLTLIEVRLSRKGRRING
jgi:hypothetical protein